MMERRLTVATSAATQAWKLLTWKSTCFFTVERSLAFCLQTVQVLLHNCWCPQEAHTNPFRKKALRLCAMQLLLYSYATSAIIPAQLPGSLKIHIRTHSGENTFNCTQCTYSCTTACNLKRHILTHSGEKSFSCTQCNYSCTTAGNLKQHLPPWSSI